MSTDKQWFLYVLLCNNGSLYTGITTDVSRRFEEHCSTADPHQHSSFNQNKYKQNKSKQNKGAKFLRGKGPLNLEFMESVGSRSNATKLEYRVKKLSKLEKEKIITKQMKLSDLTL